MRIILLLLTIISLQSALGESYFFKYSREPGRKTPAPEIENGQLHLRNPIEKIPTPKASDMIATYQGLGEGRTYKIQIDLKEAITPRTIPKLKLGDEILLRTISMSYSADETSPSSLYLESDDPEKIEHWSKQLALLLELPKERVLVDLKKPKQTKKEKVEESQREAGMGWNLNGVTEWTFNNDFKITLKKSDDGTLAFHNSKGDQLHKLKKEDRVSEVVESPSSKVFIFLLSHRNGIGGCLLRVSAPEKEAIFERIFTYSKTPLFGKDRWWISELGAVDDRGETLLAKLGWMPDRGGRVSYEWQTWSIPEERRLSKGLQVQHAAKESN